MKKIPSLINKYNNLATPVKASMWFVICYVLQRGIQFLAMPVYTRIMTQEEYGEYTVFLSWFNIIVIITSLNIHTGVFTKGLVKYEAEKDRYVSSIQVLTSISTLAFGLIILNFSGTVTKLTGFTKTVQLLLIIHLLSYPVLQFWTLDQRAQYKYKTLILITLLNSLLSFLIGVLLVLTSDDKSTTLILVTVLVQFFICLILFIRQQQRGRCFYDKQYWLWTIGLAVPLIPHALSEIILNHSDRIMISRLVGTGPAAVYTIVYQISMVMTIIRGGINGSYTPWLYYSIRDGNYKKIRSVTNMLSIFMILLTVGIMSIGPEILKIAAPSSYYEAVYDIPPIMIGCHFVFIYLLFTNVEIYYEQKKYIVIASVSAAIINILLNYIFIPIFGYLIAGYTTMISYMIMAGLHLFFLKLIAKNNPEISEIFDIRFLMLGSLFLILSGAVLYLLYDNLPVRAAIITSLIIIAIYKRKTIKNLLSVIK